MKKYQKCTFSHFNIRLMMMALLSSLLLVSCTDEYIYDNSSPSWLGSNIYDYLKSDGNFTITVKLIDDLDYDQVLGLTGSKTLFVAKDSAYTEFFKSNNWGVTKYDELSLSQKKMLLNYSLLNNAYTLTMLSNYNSSGNLVEGTAMRQSTSLVAIDTLAFDKGDQLATSSSWDYCRNKGIYLLKDNTVKPIAYFTNSFITANGLTDDDFSILTNGQTRSTNDVHVFDDKIIEGDIRCKNGYIDVLDHVLVPPNNMAQYIHEGSDTKIFSKLLDRFCVPLYDASNTSLYKTLHTDFSDSIFIKRYYASLGGITKKIDAQHNATGSSVTTLLSYDPGWNGFYSTSLEADMAAMFVPTDDAMNTYFNSGVGAILKARYGTWEDVPDDIILPFLKRHMRISLLESLPSNFSKMVDEENYSVPAEVSHIERSYMGVNGEVYVVNSVYSPVDYISVYSPVLLSSDTKVMNWAINYSEASSDGTLFAFYKLYLNSLESNYALFIPTDAYLTKYLDPISYAQDVSGVLKYWYNTKTSTVNATIYEYDKTNGIVGDSIGVITSASFLKNRLWDLLDSHIVVGGVNTGDKYFVTKGNDIIKVEGSGTSMTVQGGGDIDQGTQCDVKTVYEQENGTTYFLNKQIQPSLKSVYKVLSEHSEFSDFFNLLMGVPDSYTDQIFAQQGVDYRIKFFNAFRYTVYVPTNEAIESAISSGVISSWETINAMSEGTEQTAEIAKVVRFLKYHFQDNAVFFGQTVDAEYSSATIKNTSTDTYFSTAKNKYYKLGVKGTSSSLTITMDSKEGDAVRTANVLTSNGLYNIIAKDYIFDELSTTYKYIDGTGAVSGTAFSSSLITTSASAVIHQIDKVLTFE